MVAAPFTSLGAQNPIRKLDLARDLNPVADLIELCFPLHLDPDGKTYVREMRKTAQNMQLMTWLTNTPEFGSTATSGFVWEQDSRIIGNLSVMTLQKEGARVYLIANVAVHPDFRRMGIARKLTQSALSYLKRHSASQVWLQVRDDNQPAIDLYRSLGFIDQTARTTWRIRPQDLITTWVNQDKQIAIRRREADDWPFQQEWLEETYPTAIRWNLPVNFRRFTPGFTQVASNFLEGYVFKHWSITLDGMCSGLISWQKSDSFANNLWLALPGEIEANLLAAGLPKVVRGLQSRHQVSVDYPKGRFEEGFRAFGFEHFRTLIWMRCQF